MQRLFFRQREQKGQREFGTLILAQTIRMQPVATTAGAGIVKRQAQIVAAQKPLKRPSRFRHLKHVAGSMLRLDAGGHRGLRFDGLLVEERPFLATRMKTVGAAGTERAGFGRLNLYEPAQRLETEFHHRVFVHAASAENHRVAVRRDWTSVQYS